MSVKEIGQKLVAFCQQGKNLESISTLYSADIVSIEAGASPAGERVSTGIEAVKAKNVWWVENHEIHKAETAGPYPHGEDRFAVRFTYDITVKATGARFVMDEIGVFTVENDKIVKEEFFYDMG